MAVDIGAVDDDMLVARVDDCTVRPLLRGIGHKVLDVGAHAELRRRKARARLAVARRAEAAEVVLLRDDIAAVAEEACLLERLSKGDVRADALARTLFIVVRDELLRRNGDVRVRVVAQEVAHALLLARERRADD